MARTQIDQSLVPSAAAAFANIQNILINGGMEVWQRGTTFTNNADSTYTADRWKVRAPTPPTSYAIARESGAGNVDVGTYSMKMTITTVGSATTTIVRQTIENFIDYNGRTITFSARVKCNTAGFGIRISDGVTNYISNLHSGGNTFETLFVTATLPNPTSTLDLDIGWFPGGTNAAVSIAYIDAVMLSLGSTRPTFIPADPQVDLARCQRYYYRTGSYVSGQALGIAQAVSTTGAYTILRNPVVMRTTPTLTIVGATNFALTNATGGTLTTATVTNSTASAETLLLNITVSNSLVAGAATIFFSQATTSYIEVSADN